MSYAREIISLFPPDSFPRRLYNGRRIAFYSGYYMTEEDIRKCENNCHIKHCVVEKYIQKYPDFTNKTFRIISQLILNAPVYKKRQNDKDLVDDMLFCGLAYGFDPFEYLSYKLEDKNPKERTAFVSDRELMLDVYRMNDRVDIQIYNDKANTYLKFRPYYKRDAVIVSSKNDLNCFYEFVRKHPVFVKKKVNEAMGRSIELIDLKSSDLTPENAFEMIIGEGKCLLEEKVIQSDAMSRLNQSSVNTVRVITYYTKEGIIVPFCFAKIGRAGSFVDNGGAGGILSGIEQKTGQLNTDGFDEYSTRYSAHPDSGIVFKGYQLPEFEKAVSLAVELSKMTPTIKFIGWDFAHTDDGWVIIEGNGMSQLIGPQTVYERGVKSEVDAIKQVMELI